jgi:Ca2+-binding RTX toxin-like protein
LGEAGADRLIPGPGNDFVGGDGYFGGDSPGDVVVYDVALADVSVVQPLFRDYLIIDDGSGLDSVSAVAFYEFADQTLDHAELLALLATGDLDPQGLRVTGTPEADVLSGRLGADTIAARAGDDEIHGQTGDDSILGGAGFDSIFGEDGDDTIYGANGWDVIQGGFGNDLIFGQNGNDTIYGDTNRALFGEIAADDTISGGLGNDQINGGRGDNLLSGGPGADVIRDSSGQSTLRGDAGQDTLRGGDGDDLLQGGINNDSLVGGTGGDTLEGGNGADTLEGGKGPDHLFGNAGPDLLYDQEGGESRLNGGIGADTFLFEDWSANINYTRRLDTAVIEDFQPGIDTLRLEGSLLGETPTPADLADYASVDADGFVVLSFPGLAIRFENAATLDQIIAGTELF